MMPIRAPLRLIHMSRISFIGMIVLLLFCFAISGQAQQAAEACPFTPIPAPTGTFPVGTFILPIQKLHGTGSSRRVQFWYPAQASGKTELVGYVPDPKTLEVFRAEKFLQQPDCVFDNWAKLKTAALDRAKPMHDGKKFPFVVISPGAGMPRSAYTIYAQQLASDGFVTATVDYGAYGFLVSGDKALEEGPKEDNEQNFGLVAEDWAAHISELLDEISGKAPADKFEREISGIIDLKRIAAIGHSLGGEASLFACANDSRVRACMDADGGLDGSKLAASGIKSSALILRSHPLYSAADLAKRHRTQEEFDKMGKKSLAETQALFNLPGEDAWVISISGTGHLSFSDAPYTMPTTISRFGGTIIDPARLFAIVIHLTESYLRHQFDSGQPFRIDEFPELNLQVARVTRK
jgi:dienelactone hydrolase